MSARDLETAERVCTERQLAVVRLRQRGLGWTRIALALGVARSTAQEHWEAALRRIERAGLTDS